MGADFKELATELVGLLVEVQTLEDVVSRLRYLSRALHSLRDKSSAGISRCGVEIEQLVAMQATVDGSFTRVEDSRENSILHALYGLQAKSLVTGKDGVAAEVLQITEPVARGGNCDNTRRPFLFVNLSERHQKLIREAVALEVFKRGAELAAHREELAGCDLEIKAYGREVGDLVEAIRDKAKLANALAVSLNEKEGANWLKIYGRPYCHGSSDYASLVMMRLGLYGGLQVVQSGEILSRYGTPHTEDLRPLARGLRLAEIHSCECFDIRSAVLFRPPAPEHMIILYFSCKEGMLDEFGVFTPTVW